MRTVDPQVIHDTIRDYRRCGHSMAVPPRRVRESPQPPREPAAEAGGVEDAAVNRELAWDLCYLHFLTSPLDASSRELDRMHLGMFLASWGMYRGSGFLGQRTNLLHYDAAIDVITQYSGELTETGERGLHRVGGLHSFDVPQYPRTKRDSEACALFDEAWVELERALLPEGGTSLTLVTKVMLGVWGCIPAFDGYFQEARKALKEPGDPGFSRANTAALAALRGFYEKHREPFDGIRNEVGVIDPRTAQRASHPLPLGKVLDMFLWQYGAAQ